MSCRAAYIIHVLLIACMIVASSGVSSPLVMANEVFERTQTRVVVRVHPKTGKPFVSIVSADANHQSGYFTRPAVVNRPDYRMLEPKVKAGDVPYHGPVSDRRKVYVLAGTLAALGAAGGVIGTVAPAASSGGAASGAGLYAGGAVLTGGGPILARLAAQTDSQPEDFKMTAETRENDS